MDRYFDKLDDRWRAVRLLKQHFNADGCAILLVDTKTRETEILTQAADKQIEYGMQLRREAIAPLTRLVDAQARIQDEQLSKLQSAEQEINQIESNLNALGKRKFLGMTL